MSERWQMLSGPDLSKLDLFSLANLDNTFYRQTNFAEMRAFSDRHCSDALYHGTTLIGPYREAHEGFRVCVRTRKQVAEPKQARRAGTKRQPSPEGLGHRSQCRRAPEARHQQTYGVPRLRRSKILGICLPALPGWADVWSRPSGPVSVLPLAFAFSHTLFSP